MELPRWATKPNWVPKSAEATNRGWEDVKTGEVFVSFRNLLVKINAFKNGEAVSDPKPFQVITQVDNTPAGQEKADIAAQDAIVQIDAWMLERFGTLQPDVAVAELTPMKKEELIAYAAEHGYDIDPSERKPVMRQAVKMKMLAEMSDHGVDVKAYID